MGPSAGKVRGKVSLSADKMLSGGRVIQSGYAMADIVAIAREAIAALDGGGQVAPFSGRPAGLSLAAAYKVTAELRRLRLGRGEMPVGRKIGFTNRVLWDEYDVRAPIWGDMYDSTVADRQDEVALAPFAEPKIEPEIAFGLAAAPKAGMDEAALLGCIGWAAQGFEVVQSIFPGWRFEPADTVAGFGMHGAFVLGRRVELAAQPVTRAALEDFSMTLIRDGEEAGTGHASDVLGGPLTALRHLVELLADDPDNPPLAPGEIVTTGSVTRAFDIRPGETWETRIAGLPLPDLRLRVV